MIVFVFLINKIVPVLSRLHNESVRFKALSMGPYWNVEKGLGLGLELGCSIRLSLGCCCSLELGCSHVRIRLDKQEWVRVWAIFFDISKGIDRQCVF